MQISHMWRCHNDTVTLQSITPHCPGMCPKSFCLGKYHPYVHTQSEAGFPNSNSLTQIPEAFRQEYAFPQHSESSWGMPIPVLEILGLSAEEPEWGPLWGKLCLSGTDCMNPGFCLSLLCCYYQPFHYNTNIPALWQIGHFLLSEQNDILLTSASTMAPNQTRELTDDLSKVLYWNIKYVYFSAPVRKKKC